MKHILVLAYQVSPTKGSEYAVAWNYITHMSRLHKLTVLYGVSGKHMGDCAEMEDYLSQHALPNVTMIAVKPNRMTNLLNWCNRHDILNYTFYFAYRNWHRQVYRLAKQLVCENSFDLIHLLGPIGYREPGYLWKLNLPYLWGPVGGVSNAPAQLRSFLPWKERTKLMIRAVLNNWQFSHSHRLHKVLDRCDLLLTATTKTKERFASYKYSLYLPENGITGVCRLKEDKFAHPFPLQLIFAGRIDGNKNLKLLLSALTRIKDSHSFFLHIVGDGPERSSLMAYAEKAGISPSLKWYGQVERTTVLDCFDQAHLHVITSLNEANPTVLWEAMTHGVPTLSLDHCGMHDTICDQCGFKIPIRNQRQVLDDLTETLRYCIDHPAILKEKAFGTLQCAKRYDWEKRIGFFNACYEKAIDHFTHPPV